MVKRNSPAYKVWADMIRRCSNPRSIMFAAYGGRGIRVCLRWLKFEHFFADMGERRKGTTIDRIDNAQGYKPSNCRWISLAAQQRNRTNNHRLMVKGESLTLAEWSERTGLSESVLRYRLQRGWSADKAVLTPLRATLHPSHCKHGHEFTPENTYLWRRADGREHRQCRICNAAAHRRRAAVVLAGVKDE